MTKLFALIPLVAFGSWLIAHAADEPAANGALDPLKVLLIAGGCCHDYAGQKDLLKAGIESRLNARVDIEYTPDKSTKAVFPRYLEADWAAGYDVILHDECSREEQRLRGSYLGRTQVWRACGEPTLCHAQLPLGRFP